MKKPVTVFCLFALPVLFLAGCKKDDDDKKTGGPLTGSSEKTWTLTKYELDNVDKTSTLASCVLDNKLTFKVANNYYEENEGNLKCNPSDPQVVTSGRWDITDNSTFLKIYRTSDTIQYNLLELTETNLKIESIASGGSSQVYTYKNP